jgi:L-threonylcarbamoyladenylate synthase
MSEVVQLDDATTDAVRDRAAALLDDGQLVVVPTDTMYGVLVNPFHPDAPQRLFAARRAPRTQPLPVIVHNPRQLPALAEVGETAERLMAAFWPGPLTLLLVATGTMAWDLGEAEGTVAVRMPAEPLLLRILGRTGPLGCTAAALAGQQPPETVEQAQANLGDSVALYVDGGPRSARPSTIVDVSRGGAEVRRLGAVSADDVFAAATTDPHQPPPPAPAADPPADASPADASPADEVLAGEPAPSEDRPAGD